MFCHGMRDRNTLIVPFVRRLELHFLGRAIDRRRPERGERPNVVGDAAPPPYKPEHVVIQIQIQTFSL